MFLMAATVALALGTLLVDLYLRDRTRIQKRMDEEFGLRTRARRSPLFKDLSQLPSDSVALTEPHHTWRRRFETMVGQSGVNLTPLQVVLLSAALAVVLGGIGTVLRHNLFVGLGIGLAGAIVPFLYVRHRWLARREKLLSQLPDAFDLMARVIRAGQTMPQAIQGVADEFDAPIAAEFSYCYEQQNLGLSFDSAVRELAERTGLMEIKVLVLALLVQQETGGNLAVLLENLSSIVRSRLVLRGKIRVLTAEGRLQAIVLMAMPPVMFLVLFLLNRRYAQVLLDHPNLILITLGFMALGWLWIRRIINFEF
jgi:tight adherence protein B